MRLGYADPPYPGCANLYRDHPDYAGEVDHKVLLERLSNEFDGWVLHTSVPGLRLMERSGWLPDHIRICAWVKPFAAFKRNVPVAYAWEPVLVKAARKPHVSDRQVMRDFISEPITMKRGLTGVKPERVCAWAFEVMGAWHTDELHDLFPGTGAVTKAWHKWKSQFDEEKCPHHAPRWMVCAFCLDSAPASTAQRAVG